MLIGSFEKLPREEEFGREACELETRSGELTAVRTHRDDLTE